MPVLKFPSPGEQFDLEMRAALERFERAFPQLPALVRNDDRSERRSKPAVAAPLSGPCKLRVVK